LRSRQRRAKSRVGRPRYGIAPERARANRPLEFIFTAITFLVTILFEADVTWQGGAYATGVLVLMGEGDPTPVTRAVLQDEADPLRRRRIHVG
jgi:hypothetical protein